MGLSLRCLRPLRTRCFPNSTLRLLLSPFKSVTQLWKRHQTGLAMFPINSVVLFQLLTDHHQSSSMGSIRRGTRCVTHPTLPARCHPNKFKILDVANNVTKVVVLTASRRSALLFSCCCSFVPPTDLPPSDTRPSPSHGYWLHPAECD